MKKKRNKKYNRIKALVRDTEKLLLNTNIAFVTDDLKNPRDAEVVNDNGDLITIGRTEAHALDQLKHKWFITLVVGCYKSNGVREYKFDYVPCNHYYTHRELLDYLNERHVNWLAELEKKNVRMAWTGWVAKPNRIKELTDDQLVNIFDKLNAWY